MRQRLTLALAAALLAAAPAAAQNETTNADTANAVTTTEVTNNAIETPTDVAAVPGAQPATVPPESDVATVDTAITRGDRDDGFPWGLIGLVGLIGLLGARRARSDV